MIRTRVRITKLFGHFPGLWYVPTPVRSEWDADIYRPGERGLPHYVCRLVYQQIEMTCPEGHYEIVSEGPP
jgi:hypothetical protein